jgi:hypothetical protein
LGQYIAKRAPYEKSKYPGHDLATISSTLIAEFDCLWLDLSERMTLIPGKRVLAALNRHLQENYKLTLSANAIARSITSDHIPLEIKKLVEDLEQFRIRGRTDGT